MEASKATSDESELVLHVWPGKWDLPSIDAQCLAAVLFAQVTIPGKFVVEECIDPDSSPNGLLPYCTHGEAIVVSYPSIAKYISGIATSNEPSESEEDGVTPILATLTCTQKAQQIAWLSFVSANLGDLVACSFYTLRHNYFDYMRPLLANMFPIPQSYFVPDRLRITYRSRLESAGLWNSPADAPQENDLRRITMTRLGIAEQLYDEAQGRERVLEKARRTLDILSRLLGEKQYVHHEIPTALDALIAGHILLLTVPPLPNDILRSLIVSTYPNLHAHAQRIVSHTITSDHSPSTSVTATQDLSTYASAFGLSNLHMHSPLKVRSAPTASIGGIMARALPIRSLWTTKQKVTKTDEDRQFDRLRWAWYGLSFSAVLVWCWAVGLSIRIQPEEDESAVDKGEAYDESNDAEGEKNETDETDEVEVVEEEGEE